MFNNVCADSYLLHCAICHFASAFDAGVGVGEDRSMGLYFGRKGKKRAYLKLGWIPYNIIRFCTTNKRRKMKTIFF